jgi:hypothetical protein
MSSSQWKESPDVQVDRLVLDIPGLNAAQARSLAFGIGERLAGASLSGEHAKIEIELGPTGARQADLADRIVAAVIERLV